jgi:plasmid stabilization system protein ParE
VTRRFQIDPLASAELAETVRWYELQRPGLGAACFDAFLATLDRIAAHPEVGAPAVGINGVRRAPVPGFPYQLVYRVAPDRLQIIAFAHVKRRPGFWRHRS